MKVVVLTTSYPRSADDVAGAFVRDAVEHLRDAGIDGSGRLACVVPSLRARVRARNRRKPQAPPLEGSLGAAVPRVLRDRRPARGPRCGSRARALASVGAARGEDAQAVRASALGHGRRARGARTVAGTRARTPRADRAVPLRVARRCGSRSGRTRSARRRERGRHPERGRRTGRAHRTRSSSAVCRRRRVCSTSSLRPRACRV